MKGKRVIVTGPTSGVGREMALQLAELEAEVILACRDVKKGEEVAEEIKDRTDSKVVVMMLDTSSQESIWEFAQEFRNRYDRLDVLINNAGGNRGTLPKINSVDGIELTFATNVLGYFLLTQELLDLLKRSAPSRIINVASVFASDLDLYDLEFQRRPFESIRAYAQSKACDRMLTWALARRLEGTGVTANAMTPGLITETELYRNAAADLVQRLTKISGGRTSARGADTAVWLASDPEMESVSGKFCLCDSGPVSNFRYCLLQLDQRIPTTIPPIKVATMPMMTIDKEDRERVSFSLPPGSTVYVDTTPAVGVEMGWVTILV